MISVNFRHSLNECESILILGCEINKLTISVLLFFAAKCNANELKLNLKRYYINILKNFIYHNVLKPLFLLLFYFSILLC